jgi:hypothetical protein
MWADSPGLLELEFFQKIVRNSDFYVKFLIIEHSVNKMLLEHQCSKISVASAWPGR